ncbi:chitobiase/beta-hexosaminidase C-terminal domain-containing protein [Bacillus sp. M6-12]|uniref:chitobiase/beta-hexosaminidase C-terminal domain-containing protein n=1 Tax=Bacillus sp. M6-12 TaxID=2054166 RepID=UPI002155E930|nr:chitobiase/beta-hexosaminidase C-terminal domain-containing protein [Bacillus sp. M6-12]
MRRRKSFSLALIFTILISLFAPFNSANAAEAITVAEAIANKTGTATVEGYIVGTTANGPTYNHSGPFTVKTNIAIADNPNETDKARILPVRLPTDSDERAALNLVDNPANLGKKVQLTGTLGAYFGVPGIATLTGYEFINDTDPTATQPVVAAPTPGPVASGTTVTLTSATEGATIFYTTDGSAPSTSSSQYTEPITIDKATTIKAFASASGLEDSEVTTFEYSVLQEQMIAQVRELPVGQSALTSGIVTAVFGNTVYIQDESAGLVLYGSNLNIAPGDKVQALGKLADYNSLLELEVKSENVKVIEKAELPEADELTAAELQENKEATLVTVKKVNVESFAGGNYTAKDANGTSFQIRPQDAALLSVDTTYDSITGVLGAYKGVYQLIPRDASDIIADSTKVQRIVAIPGPGLIKTGDKVTLTTGTEGASIYYTTDNTNPTTSSQVYSSQIEITKDTVIKAIAVKEGLTATDVSTFNYIIQKDVVRIHDIQAAAHYSPYDGINVSDIEGVVTKVVDANNFYMQDLQPDNDEKTSEGILVYKKAHGLKVGDAVKVSGQVKEYVLEGYAEKQQTDLPVTEINATGITVTASGQALPAPVVIGKDRIPPTEVIDNDRLTTFDPEQDGIDFFESLEGMLVQVDNAKIVAPQKYGEVIVIPGSLETNTDTGGLRITETDYNPERITIDINDENFIAKMGDSFAGSIQGVVSYGYSNYKVLSNKTDLPALVEGSNTRETTTIAAAADKLTIASYNVENFSTKTPDTKVTKLAEAIVNNLKQPDIIGLTEVQDNDGETDSGNTDASQSFEALIAKIKELGGGDYLYTDVAPLDKQDGGAPGGNIRVGFLYKKDRVTLVPGTKGTATEAVDFENGKLTLNPGRIDPTNSAFESSRKPLAAQFEFNGKNVIVVANHFNSKGGDLPLFGKVQPPVLQSEIQRMKIAEIVNGFVKDVKAKDPNANIVLLGDFNDFEFSNTLRVLKGNELTNMIEKVPAEQRYSYNYQGNAQVLDHILVSNNLAVGTQVDIVHINSGFMEEHGRASDHDPVLIQTSLNSIEAPNYDKEYNLIGYKADKLKIKEENALISMDSTSTIKDGIYLMRSTATLKGEGLEKTTVIIAPSSKDAEIDFTGAEVKEVMIESKDVKEIRGAENVQHWNVKKNVDTSSIKFFNSNGEEIASPLAPKKKAA